MQYLIGQMLQIQQSWFLALRGRYVWRRCPSILECLSLAHHERYVWRHCPPVLECLRSCCHQVVPNHLLICNHLKSPLSSMKWCCNINALTYRGQKALGKHLGHVDLWINTIIICSFLETFIIKPQSNTFFLRFHSRRLTYIQDF